MAESLAQVISKFLAMFYLLGSAHQRQGLPFGKFMVVERPCSKTDMPAFEQRHSTRKNLPTFPLHTRKENLSIGNVYNKELTNCQILVKCPWLVWRGVSSRPRDSSEIFGRSLKSLLVEAQQRVLLATNISQVIGNLSRKTCWCVTSLNDSVTILRSFDRFFLLTANPPIAQARTFSLNEEFFFGKFICSKTGAQVIN